jgi:hypothetical protein
VVQLLTWTDDGLIVADHMPTVAAARTLQDLDLRGFIAVG